jgi:inhibitor of KinA
MPISIQPIGDNALKVTYPGEVSPTLNKQIRQFDWRLQAASVDGVIEWVPTFNAVTIYYEPHQITYYKLRDLILNLHKTFGEEQNLQERFIDIPVLYGGSVGPDLQRVAKHNQLSTAHVIKLHQNREYLVYMLGFLPGFPYLGGLDNKIATPRLETPRTKTFAGSVGIAHEQTGIYPVDSPGGWNIIGKTPIQLFDMHHETSPFLFRAGDRVRFYSVSEREYDHISVLVKMKTYQVNIRNR